MKTEPITWGECLIEEGQTRSFSCGDIVVECRRAENEVILASRAVDDEEPDQPGSDAPSRWTRWAVCTGGDSVSLLPRLPNLPLLVEPEDPFRITPGAEARVFLRIPVSVAVNIQDPRSHELTFFPTETLSQTWFGETDSGELCYYLPSAVYRMPKEALDEAGVQAPVRIRNESNETLEVTRICLRVEGLAIHRKDARLWANETVVRFQGGENVSRIEVVAGPPPEAVGGEKIVSAPELKAREMVARTFRSLRKWTASLLDEGT